ncbi:MAG TPA: hypothetical protein VFN36_03455 [Solirubrobacteraceae bacterium]|nr:hypothetical protein [Solirubrobacteraceae bacterium]
MATVTSPVSDPPETGNSGHMPASATLLGKIPTDKISMGKLPRVDVLVDQEAIGQLKAQLRRRPEIGLGAAFAAGLALATIVKRLGRK